jgi:hypothetical protein
VGIAVSAAFCEANFPACAKTTTLRRVEILTGLPARAHTPTVGTAEPYHFFMAQLPSYDQWMKDTYSLTSPRSEYLLKLDEAIKTQNRDTIKTAFDRWRFEQSKQGKKWMESVRNKKGAVTNLHRALTDVDRRQLTDQEIESMRWASQQQALALQKMFLSRDVKFKSNT